MISKNSPGPLTCLMDSNVYKVKRHPVPKVFKGLKGLKYLNTKKKLKALEALKEPEEVKGLKILEGGRREKM